MTMEDRESEMEFEETELTLGLGCGGGRKQGGGGGGDMGEEGTTTNGNGKRSHAQTNVVDLKLKLAPNETSTMDYLVQKQKDLLLTSDHQTLKLPPPSNMAQIVGWPPVRSIRKIPNVQNQKIDDGQGSDKFRSGNRPLVKVSMHGAPYLRKVDLNSYKNYRELADALANMFHVYASEECEAQGMVDFTNECNLIDLLNSSNYVPTYKDKDGDCLLVGDVPWEMFVESCKRLRIMKGSKAIGLAPRAVEKCKNVQELDV